jgi:hypothetical protein
MKFKTSDGIEYERDGFGVIHQLNPKPFTYDAAYSATYDKPEYRVKSDLLQGMRLGFIVGAFGGMPDSLLDWGYGNGAFMEFAKYAGVRRVMGFDLTGIEVEECEIVSSPQLADVHTFHDVMEHIPDLSFVKDIPAKMLVVSLPWCHWADSSVDEMNKWFSEWKHRKPNEHIHHFNKVSLTRFMKSMGWKLTATSTHEDVVRQAKVGEFVPNILTVAFKRDL